MAEVRKEQFTLQLGQDLFLRGDVRIIEDGQIKPILIVVHGFKGFKDWGMFPYLCEAFARKGYAVISFNFTCNGVGVTDFDELDKFAINTYSREQADLDALISHVIEGTLPLSNDFDTERIALLGHSRGGGNSIIYASSQKAIRAVATWNGIADVNLFGEAFRVEVLERGVGYVANARTHQQMPIRDVFFTDIDSNTERFDIAAVLASLPIPVLLLQGDQDAERLLSGNRKLREAAPDQEHATIQGGNHTFGAVHPFAGTTEYLERALQLTEQFLQKHLET